MSHIALRINLNKPARKPVHALRR